MRNQPANQRGQTQIKNMIQNSSLKEGQGTLACTRQKAMPFGPPYFYLFRPGSQQLGQQKVLLSPIIHDTHSGKQPALSCFDPSLGLAMYMQPNVHSVLFFSFMLTEKVNQTLTLIVWSPTNPGYSSNEGLPGTPAFFFKH